MPQERLQPFYYIVILFLMLAWEGSRLSQITLYVCTTHLHKLPFLYRVLHYPASFKQLLLYVTGEYFAKYSTLISRTLDSHVGDSLNVKVVCYYTSHTTVKYYAAIAIGAV